jgi:hypothetical protein
VDYLGAVPIPDPPVVAPFPLTGDYGGGMDYEPQIATHVFDQPGLKTEQRYLMGAGTRRFRIQRDHLSCNELNDLKSHWQQAFGQYAQFPFTYRGPGGDESITARYENPNLDFAHLTAYIASINGLTLLEVPASTPTYNVAAEVSRFPDTVLTPALEAQVQQFIPLISIYPRGVADILRVSNQRCSVGGNLYLPRLLDWTGISQTINETSDSASFALGNADDVFVTYANQTNLYRADIAFALYHVNTGYLINLWAGYARPWTLTSDGMFILPASDGLYELTLAYPWRNVSRTCWKKYKGPHCPSTSSHSDCPKDYAACVERGVPKSFGGVVAVPSDVRVRDKLAALVGIRSRITSVSVAEESAYQRPLQEVYTDKPMKVNCDVAAGRDEDTFYSALGIVGEGPIGKYSLNLIKHQLDNQPPHDPRKNGGWRGILGTDPAAPSDFFALDRAPWGMVPSEATYAAGVAFAEIRRTDEKGLQLAAVSDRAMTVTVDEGIAGWTWTAPGARVWTSALSNPVWVAVNVYLRAIGLRVDPSRAADIPVAVMEDFVDIPSCIAAAAICEEVVESMIVPGTYERQFPFRGVIRERKPLKDWLQEILNCCCGWFTFVTGKLWIGIRFHSGTPSEYTFTRANILFKSLEASPLSPRFNWLTGSFGDEEFDWALNSVTLYDISHALWMGEATGSPQYLQSTMNFVGVSNKSQCARLITTRLREELGGLWDNAGVNEQIRARHLRFRTTLLALKIMCGDVIRLDHVRLPGGRGEGRVQSWTLNPDFSIDITASCTTDSMYLLTTGPKPADGPSKPVPPELLQSISGLAWMPNHVAPFPGDPLYPDTREKSFDLWQDYNIQRDGVWSPAIWVGGEEVINQFIAPVQPRITNVVRSAGGHISGPVTVYVAVTMRDLTGAPSSPSNLYALWIPEGVVDQKLTISMIPAPSGTWAGWDLYIGTDRRRIALQESRNEALPSSYQYTGFLAPMTQQLPDAAAERVRLAAKHVWHSGVAGVLVTGVTAPNQIQADNFIGATDNWVGRYLSALADLSDGSAPLWNFQVTAFNPATGTFTVTPDCVRGDPADSVEPGDVLIVRSIGVSAGMDWVEDPLWNNSVGRLQFPDTNGLRPDEEIGRLYRILRGKGAGQVRAITANTNVRVTVEPPWEVQPDATSVGIIEAHDWDYAGVTSELLVPRPGQAFELRVRVDNLATMVALVGGFLVDREGRISDEEFAVYREIFIYGQPPGVREVGPEALDPETSEAWTVYATDQTIRADTSERDIAVQLLPLAQYQGRTMYFSNDNGPNNLTVFCWPGEFLFDGLETVTVPPQETLRVTAG